MSRSPLSAGEKTAVLACGISLLIGLSSTAAAFYDRHGETGKIDLRGFLQAIGTWTQNPADESFYPHNTDAAGGAVGRLLILANRGNRAAFEFNAYQTYTTTSGALSAAQASAQGSLPGHPERSAALEWGQIHETDRDARLGVDRLSLRLSLDRVDLTLGRQPVNLATVFYFTPNDFFAPFAPQTFFRVYKPGVDAARVEVRLGELSQLSVVDVLGYEPAPSMVNGWSREPSIDRSSVLARVSTSILGFEWAALGGRVHDRTLVGASWQGEWGRWLGIRAEGHYAAPSPGRLNSFVKAAVDLEHRFDNSLTVRLEPYYNSGGYGSIQDVNESRQAGSSTELFGARAYTELGFGYEFSPLLSGEVLSIANWADPSYLLSFNSVTSLSNEAEFSFGFSLPAGKRPSGGEVRSEFGLLPASVSAEIRTYF